MIKMLASVPGFKRIVSAFVFVALFAVAVPWSFAAGGGSVLSSTFSADSIKGVTVPDITSEQPERAAAGQFTGLPAYAFSDDAALDQYLIKIISSSRQSIELCIYSFTLENVAAELIKARNRGIAVRVIMDQHHVFTKKRAAAVQMILDAGIELRTLRGTWTYGVNHNKIGVYDRQLVSAGSFNWSNNAAYNNYENIVFSKKPSVVIGYAAYFDYMWAMARPFSTGPTGELPFGFFPKPPMGPGTISFAGTSFPEYSFSPMGGSRDYILRGINGAKKSIAVASFTFSDKQFARALAAAAKRGVSVRVLTDKATAKTRGFVSWMVMNGVTVKLGAGRKGGSMHHKFAIFDGQLLETGSHNWTGNAEVNDFENVFYTNSQSYISGYQRKFDQLYGAALMPDLNALPAPEDMNAADPETRGAGEEITSDGEVD